MKGPETRLRVRIKEALLDEYPRAFISKIHGGPYQDVGLPDYICCIEGYYFGLEVKLPGEKASAVQQVIGKRILQAKGFFAVVTSPEEAVDFIRAYFDLIRSSR